MNQVSFYATVMLLLSLVIPALAQDSNFPVVNGVEMQSNEACFVTTIGAFRSSPSTEGELLQKGVTGVAHGFRQETDGIWYLVSDISSSPTGWLREDIVSKYGVCDHVPQITEDVFSIRSITKTVGSTDTAIKFMPMVISCNVLCKIEARDLEPFLYCMANVDCDEDMQFCESLFDIGYARFYDAAYCATSNENAVHLRQAISSGMVVQNLHFTETDSVTQDYCADLFIPAMEENLRIVASGPNKLLCLGYNASGEYVLYTRNIQTPQATGKFIYPDFAVQSLDSIHSLDILMDNQFPAQGQCFEYGIEELVTYPTKATFCPALIQGSELLRLSFDPGEADVRVPFVQIYAAALAE